jgi:hypothetical protein
MLSGNGKGLDESPFGDMLGKKLLRQTLWKSLSELLGEILGKKLAR